MSPGVHGGLGPYVALAGPDGCGKSSQAKMLVDWLTAEGADVGEARWWRFEGAADGREGVGADRVFQGRGKVAGSRVSVGTALAWRIAICRGSGESCPIPGRHL